MDDLKNRRCLVAIDGQNLMTTTINEWGYANRIDVAKLKTYIINFLKNEEVELKSIRYYLGNNTNGDFLKVLQSNNYAIRKSRNHRKDNVDALVITEVAMQKDNFDVFILVAGDGDYLDLLEGLYYAGKEIYALFFDGVPLSNEIKNLLGINFIDINSIREIITLQS